MKQLIISIAFLAIAPLLYLFASRFKTFWSYIRKSIVIVLTLLIVLHLLPECYEDIGLWSVAFAALGLFLPSIIERIWHKKAHSVHFFSVFVAVFGLFVHGIIDGISLSAEDLHLHFHEHHNHGGHYLGLAVLLHRLPVGLFIWSLFYPRKGPVVPSLILVLLGLATIVGYFFGSTLITYFDNHGTFAFFQSLVSGSLLHIAFDRHK